MILGNSCFFIASLLVALMAGLFFSFSIAVTRGLKKLDDKCYLQAMQRINKAILNPVFLWCFIGAPLFLIGTTFIRFLEDHSRFMWMLVISLVYMGGVFMVTMLCNVPLNNYLEQQDMDQLDPEAARAVRFRFEAPWNRYNHVRTLFAALAFGMMLYIGIF
ncbi:anthrone oxygenase family protein [Niabella sp.]|uniref:anthrone oxygenase family protein n=1 Tax=Niabella sp. TaxID=1962976 RepID=UPI002612A83A|nr:anthrone oxygenase family protein [Niabella sp.]